MDRITRTCCAGSGAVSSSRLTGKRRFRRLYKTHGASARFLRPGSAAFYTSRTFPERRRNQDRARVRSGLKPWPRRRDVVTLASNSRFLIAKNVSARHCGRDKADLFYPVQSSYPPSPPSRLNIMHRRDLKV